VRNDSARTRAWGEPWAFLNERDVGGEWGEGWNSRTRYSSVSTAVLTLFLLRANSCSFTTSSSRTSPSAVRSARQSEFPCWALQPPVRFRTRLKPVLPALNAVRKPPFPLNQLREGRSSVANVSSSGDSRRPRHSVKIFVTARMAGQSGRSGRRGIP